MTAPQAQPYPLSLEGALDAELSRWRWLVKWLLAIPHFVVLASLWVAFVLLTPVAFVAILATGRYPRPLFDFNVGVLRWSWRVSYYATNVLGTDRYPPFTLADDAGYPARLDVARPASLSGRLVLVKWWLLALPHYLIVAALSALVSVSALVAGVALLFTGRYPADLHALNMGMNRWTYRVTAYAALMTDVYPPFRLDAGSAEPTARIGDAKPVTAIS
jgi:hypothetical protein